MFMNSVSYSAVVLDNASKVKLKEVFDHLIPDSWEWVGHHMTICMGPLSNSGITTEIGQTVVLSVDAVGKSETALAVKVVGFYSKNAIPHITLGVNRQNGGKPKDSNKITDWLAYNYDLRLTGTVQEIYN